MAAETDGLTRGISYYSAYEKIPGVGCEFVRGSGTA